MGAMVVPRELKACANISLRGAVIGLPRLSIIGLAVTCSTAMPLAVMNIPPKKAG